VFARFFHNWERQLAAAATGRMVRPFEWGLDWLPAIERARPGDPGDVIEAWSRRAAADSDAFYATVPAPHYALGANGELTFDSALTTPHAVNNVVHARYFEARRTAGPRCAVLVLPQWNSDAEGHIGLAKLLARFGMSALRMSLPYHDVRKPDELTRADYIVSANIGRTVQVCRQAVLDARRSIMWLASRGYERIGVLGTSLGSCLSMLTAAHEPLVSAAALNHVSPNFADVVWEGLSTAHVRESLDGQIDLERLRRVWLPISPSTYLSRMRTKRVLLVYARYDLTFPLHLSKELIATFTRDGQRPQVSTLPCGHYSTGVAPFKYMDAWVLIRFLRRSLGVA
jgi:dienelactone hydrolase